MQQQFANRSGGAEDPIGVHGTYAASSGMEQYIPSPYMPKVHKSLDGISHPYCNSKQALEGVMCLKFPIYCSGCLVIVLHSPLFTVIGWKLYWTTAEIIL